MLTIEKTGTATAALFARLYQGAHGWLEGAIDTLTPEQAAWTPPGLALPAGAHYAHVLLSEDFLIGGALGGGAPLVMSSWQGRTGISELPPPAVWDEWARRVVVDLPTARQYAQAVYAATDAYLAGATAADLAREIDLTAFGFGIQTAEYLLNNLLLNASAHCGEIACLKGLQGTKGYGF
jgi:hypothetical protein